MNAAQKLDEAIGQRGGPLAVIEGMQPKPLPPELAPVEPFPLAALPTALRPWVEDVAERMQCPPDFVAVPLLVGAASLAARHVMIRLRRLDDWRETANLWALIVGRPGVMKSPAMRAALAPLERMEARDADVFNEAMAQHRAETMAAKLRADEQTRQAKKALQKDRGADVTSLLAAIDELPEPTRRRCIVNAPTWEKLHALLSENPGGLLMVRDEMSGWLRDLGREESAEARSFFVQGWSGGSVTVDRIGRGTITARDMRLSIVGAIQPGPLGQVMRASRSGAGDDGLIERFLVAWPDDPGEWRDIDRFPDGTARLRVREAFERLEVASPWSLQADQLVDADGEPDGLPVLGLDDGALEMFVEWRAELERRLRAHDGEPHETALTKFRHHVPALALTTHLADGGTGLVTAAAMGRALALGDYFESHARRLHGSGQRAAVRAARLILQKAKAGALDDPFSARNVYKPGWSGLGDREVAADALDLLVAHGWLTEATVGTGGRPTTLYSLTEGARRG
jgi:putative DNA primase/helicase